VCCCCAVSRQSPGCGIPPKHPLAGRPNSSQNQYQTSSSREQSTGATAILARGRELLQSVSAAVGSPTVPDASATAAGQSSQLPAVSPQLPAIQALEEQLSKRVEQLSEVRNRLNLADSEVLRLQRLCSERKRLIESQQQQLSEALQQLDQLQNLVGSRLNSSESDRLEHLERENAYLQEAGRNRRFELDRLIRFCRSLGVSIPAGIVQPVPEDVRNRVRFVGGGNPHSTPPSAAVHPHVGQRRVRGPEQLAAEQLAREEADGRARARRLGQLPVQQTTGPQPAGQTSVPRPPTASEAAPPRPPRIFGRGVAQLRHSQAGVSSGAGVLSLGEIQVSHLLHVAPSLLTGQDIPRAVPPPAAQATVTPPASPGGKASGESPVLSRSLSGSLHFSSDPEEFAGPSGTGPANQTYQQTEEGSVRVDGCA
jgi:hypothetical protein